MIKIVVDGYNVIRQVSDLSRTESISLEEGRNRLIYLLSQYKKHKRHPVYVVFDGQPGLGESSHFFKEKGIHINYSSSPTIADEVICNMAQKEKDRLVVVTSDREIQNFARSCGSAVIDSPTFYDKLVFADQFFTKGLTQMEKADPKKTHKRWATKKKGPKKRLPKKQRKNQQKLKKL